nr:hypothetical protein [Pseudomonadota bacterium]
LKLIRMLLIRALTREEGFTALLSSLFKTLIMLDAGTVVDETLSKMTAPLEEDASEDEKENYFATYALAKVLCHDIEVEETETYAHHPRHMNERYSRLYHQCLTEYLTDHLNSLISLDIKELTNTVSNILEAAVFAKEAKVDIMAYSHDVRSALELAVADLVESLQLNSLDDLDRLAMLILTLLPNFYSYKERTELTIKISTLYMNKTACEISTQLKRDLIATMNTHPNPINLATVIMLLENDYEHHGTAEYYLRLMNCINNPVDFEQYCEEHPDEYVQAMLKVHLQFLAYNLDPNKDFLAMLAKTAKCHESEIILAHDQWAMIESINMTPWAVEDEDSTTSLGSGPK